MEKQQRKDKWIAAGLAELAEHGLDGVRVEVLAKRLGVTKGGFYRQFHDRQALLNAMLIEWGNGRIHAIRQQTALEREAPRDRLKSIIRLFAERANAQGAAIELAIRQWARSDEKAAATVVRVDEERLERVCDLYRRLGYSAQDARARAVLLYGFLFGRGLLFLNAPGAEESALTNACAALLTAGP